jgi:hypothetical protein
MKLLNCCKFRSFLRKKELIDFFKIGVENLVTHSL